MDSERIKYFEKLTKKMFKEFGDEYFNIFTNTELLSIIEESRLNERDKEIVISRIIKDMTYEEIADNLDVDVRTCFKAMFSIELKMFQTCIKMFIK